MTDEETDAAPSGPGVAPIDVDRLDVIRDRLVTDDRFDRVEARPAFAPDRVSCVFAARFYPSDVETAKLTIVWYENGDFSLHYHEELDDGTFDHRWDRHPSTHNARDHVHPGPNAPTPGDDADHPADWRDVLSMALAAIEERQRAFWMA